MDYIEAFRQTVARTPDHIAIEHPDGERCTYATLDDRTTALAKAIDDRIGDTRTASLLDNGQPAIEALVGAFKRGRGNVPLNTQSASAEQAFAAENGNAKLLIYDASNADAVASVLERTDIERALYVGDDPQDVAGVTVESYEDAVAAQTGAAEYERHGDEGAIFHTSGTTGKPKGVLADQTKSWYTSSQLVMDSAISPEDKALLATPLYHVVSSISWTFAHFLVGATIVPQRKFSPAETMALIDSHDVTNAFLVPAQWRAILRNLDNRSSAFDSVRQARTGGALIEEDTVAEIRDRICEDFYTIYGLTESISNVTVGRPADHDRAPGTVGKATINWELRVVEPADHGEKPDPDAIVELGGSGEVLVRSPVAADGYMDRPDAEEELFIDGWIRTGDIAHIDENRNLFIIDRIDNLIISGGENIYPQEVENVLEEHESVEEAGVIGVPDDKWGTAVKAVIVPADEDLTRDDLDEFCKAHDGLADYKRPKRYQFVSASLPRSPLGKLRRGILRDEYGS